MPSLPPIFSPAEQTAHSKSHHQSLLGLKCDDWDPLLGFLLDHGHQLPAAKQAARRGWNKVRDVLVFIPTVYIHNVLHDNTQEMIFVSLSLMFLWRNRGLSSSITTIKGEAHIFKLLRNKTKWQPLKLEQTTSMSSNLISLDVLHPLHCTQA